jgi:ankyrin repeat protein
MLAAARGYRDIVEALLRAGADENLTDKRDKTALDYARAGRRVQTAALLEAAAGE